MRNMVSDKAPRIAFLGPIEAEGGRPGQYMAPPLGIHRIADYVSRRARAHVVTIDPNLIGVSEATKKVLLHRPELVGFSTLAPTLRADLSLLAELRKALPQSLFVIGGQGVAGLERQLVEEAGIDCVVRGFGEFATVAILRIIERAATGESARKAVLTSPDLREIPNLTIRTANGRYVNTKPAALTEDDFAAVTASFDHSRVPYGEYWRRNEQRYSPTHLNLMKNQGLTKTIRLITQTHCPLGCNYCSSTRFLDVIPGRRQRVFMQTAAEILRSIELAIAAHPETTAFYINDDDFALHRRRALEFSKLVRDRFGRRFSFICMTRVDKVDLELASALKEAGFRLIFLGVETFAQKTLDDMEKRVRVRPLHTGRADSGGNSPYTCTARQAVLTLLDAGITPQIGLIPFYPSVEETDLLTTIDNAVDLVARGARLSIFPLADAYPGASMFNNNGYEITTEEIRLGDVILTVPKQFLPRDPKLREIAQEVIASHEKAQLDQDRLPQPVDGLLFFRRILMRLGRSCAALDATLAGLMAGVRDGVANPSLYMNA
jgi:radical SAM superfamily enzyme YgiQ (UPF0313 family)